MKPIGLLGGTFNPVHEGHIAIAQHVLKSCELSHIEFIPCFQPPHRQEKIASANDRLAMLQLAIKNHPQFFINDYEMEQKKTSYTINTVTHCRQNNPIQPICLILGADAFAHFQEWHEWQKILDTVHLIVVTRNMTVTQNNRQQPFIQNRETQDINDLHSSIAGKIYFDTITPIPYSATQIRHDIASEKKDIEGLNPMVLNYILEKKIYKN